MNDVAIPLARNGCGLTFPAEVLWELGPLECHALVTHRYVAMLMRPMWGVLFTTGEEDADSDE